MSSIYDYLKGKGYFGDDSDDDMAPPTDMGPPVSAAPVATQYARAAADTSDVQGAQDTADRKKMISGIFNGLSTAFAGQKNTDNGFYAGLDRSAQADADRAKATHEQQLGNILTQDKLQQQGVDRSRVATDFANKQAMFGQQQKGWDVENQKNDPNSPTSQRARASVVGVLGPQYAAAVNGMSDNEIAAAGGIMKLKASLDEKRIEADQRSKDRAVTSQGMNDARNARADDKRDLAIKDATFKMSNDLDTAKGRNGPMGAAALKVQNAEALQALASGQGDNLDPRQVEELAIGMNKMLSGSSSPASHQVKALVPSSAIGDAAKLKEWLFNEPMGTNQQEFMKRMQDTVNREADVARTQIKKYQAGKLGGHQWLQQNAANAYNRVLQGQGIDPSEIDAKGQYISKPAAQAKPKTIQQGDYTYTLNEATGEYE